ncbi:transcription elongation factor [Gelidibacter salicanalis]|uniref:Transcription elongation factor n=1 Tax=Gelidibacter salicanalis TaxID=291193 RepID=A0A934KSP1_9FLAO|nr:transcription elongation factor [Gelidibacter salicanalis]MBJ7882864.1 transcription elongation factor [Gelidibacter salicanalis]
MKLKSDVLQACYDYANKRIANYKNEIETIKDAIESNDKGSGDDDDSGNGKLFNDLEKNSIHLIDAQKMLDSLKAISPKMVYDTVTLGSLVKTTTNTFFISISAGKIDLDDFSVFAISLGSPIGMLLNNKTAGDLIEFNGNTFTIIEVI